MAPKDTPRASDNANARAEAQDERALGERHSDVVPKDFSQVIAALRGHAQLRAGGAPHLSWPETGLRVPDETRSAWMSAYESGFDHAFATCTRGDWLVPLVYAAGDNDESFGRALLRFVYEVSLDLPELEEAFAVLEVAEATLEGGIGKDLCARIAENLIEEAYARFEQTRDFGRYFFCHSAAAVARLAANVTQPSSARDAVEAIQSAVAAVRAERDPRGEADASEVERPVLELAAKCIRDALSAAPLEREREPNLA